MFSLQMEKILIWDCVVKIVDGNGDMKFGVIQQGYVRKFTTSIVCKLVPNGIALLLVVPIRLGFLLPKFFQDFQ